MRINYKLHHFAQELRLTQWFARAFALLLLVPSFAIQINCAPNLQSDARITCTSGDDCPSGWTCKENAEGVAQCVESSGAGADVDPPSLNEDVLVTPSSGKDGTFFTVCFSVGETLSSTPEVHLNAGAGLILLDALESKPETCNDHQYAYGWTASADRASSGTHPLTVTLFDEALNKAEGLSLGNLTLDFSAPMLTSTTIDSTFLGLSASSEITELNLEIASNEPLASAPHVYLVKRLENDAPDVDDTAPISWTLASQQTELQFEFTLEADDSYEEGEYTLFIDLQDLAGNKALLETNVLIVMDKTAPVFELIDVWPSTVVTVGDRIEITIEAEEEALSQIPSLQLSPQPEMGVSQELLGTDENIPLLASPSVTINPENGNLTLRYIHTVRYSQCSKTLSDAQETSMDKDLFFDAAFIGGTDLAGNAAAPLDIPQLFRIDCLSPSVVDTCIFAANESSGDCQGEEDLGTLIFRSNDRLAFQATFSEPVLTPLGDEPEVYVGDFVLELCSTDDVDECCQIVDPEIPISIFCETVLDSNYSDGEVLIFASVSDNVNNLSFPDLSVIQLDTTYPTLAAFGDQQSVGLYDNVVFTLNASEPVDFSSLTVPGSVFPGLILGEPVINEQSTQATWTFAIESSVEFPSGTYSNTLEINDLAGNMSSIGIGPLVIDSEGPSISEFQFNNGDVNRFSVVPGHNEIQIRFALNEHFCVTGDEDPSCVAGSSVSAQLLTRAIECENPGYVEVFGHMYQCDLTLTPELLENIAPGGLSDGTYVIEVSASDGVGNTATRTASFILDTTAPLLAPQNVSLSARWAGNNDTIRLSLFPSEELGTIPHITMSNGVDEPLTNFLDYQAGSQYAFDHLVSPQSPTLIDVYPIITLEDVAGNTSTQEFPMVLLSIDHQLPRIERSSIELSNGATYSFQPGFNAIDISFRVNESLCDSDEDIVDAGSFSNGTNSCDVNDGLTVKLVQGLLEQAFDCEQTTAPNGLDWNFQCALLLDENDPIFGSGAMNGFTDGTGLIAIETIDLGLNQDSAFVPIQLDFTPPLIDSPNLTIIPDSGNSLQAVTAARTNSTINFSFAASEFLGIEVQPQLSCASLEIIEGSEQPTGETLAHDLPAGTCQLTGNVNTCSFKVVTSHCYEDCACSLEFTLTDLVGNTSDNQTRTELQLTIDNSRPTISEIDFDAVQMIRAPFGSRISNQNIATLFVSSDTDPLDGFFIDSQIPAASFQQEREVFIARYNLYDQTGTYLGGALRNLNTETFGPVFMANTDLHSVFIELVDRAGNRSDTIGDQIGYLVPNVQWVGTMNLKEPYDTSVNPLVLESRPELSSALLAEGSRELGEADLQESSTRRTVRGYTMSNLTHEGPGGFEKMLLTDLARGGVVAFRLLPASEEYNTDIVACSGLGRQNTCGQRSTCSQRPAIAYNHASGESYAACVVTAFGFGTGSNGGIGFGGGSLTLEDEISAVGDTLLNRYEASTRVAYSRITPETQSGQTCADSINAPRIHSGHQVAYNSDLRTSVLSGGSCSASTATKPVDRLWAIGQETTWTEIEQDEQTAPEHRLDAATLWDPINDRVLMFGGLDRQDTLHSSIFELVLSEVSTDGVYRWSQLNTSGGLPPARRGASFAFDHENQMAVLYGGNNGSTTLTDVWTFDLVNHTWREIVVSDPEGDGNPIPYENANMAYDPFHNSMRVSGQSSDWLWNGVSFQKLPTENSLNQSLYELAAAYPNYELVSAIDPASQEIMVVGYFSSDEDTVVRAFLYQANESGHYSWTEPAAPPLTVGSTNDGGVLWEDVSIPGFLFDGKTQRFVLIDENFSILAYEPLTNEWITETVQKPPLLPVGTVRITTIPMAENASALLLMEQSAYVFEYDAALVSYVIEKQQGVLSPFRSTISSAPAAAYAPDDDLIFLFGGTEETEGRLGVYEVSTATLEASQVTGCHGLSAPEPRTKASLVWHPNLERMVLAGGETFGGSPLSDFWTLEPDSASGGYCWQERQIQSSLLETMQDPFMGTEMVYDPIRQTLLFFGPYPLSPSIDANTYSMTSQDRGLPGQVLVAPWDQIDGNAQSRLINAKVSFRSGGNVDEHTGAELLVWSDYGWLTVDQHQSGVDHLDSLTFSTDSSELSATQLLHNNRLYFAVQPHIGDGNGDGPGTLDGGVLDGGPPTLIPMGGMIETDNLEVVFEYRLD